MDRRNAAATVSVHGSSAVESGDSEDLATAHGHEELLWQLTDNDSEKDTESREGNEPWPGIGTGVTGPRYLWHLEFAWEGDDQDTAYALN